MRIDSLLNSSHSEAAPTLHHYQQQHHLPVVSQNNIELRRHVLSAQSLGRQSFFNGISSLPSPSPLPPPPPPPPPRQITEYSTQHTYHSPYSRTKVGTVSWSSSTPRQELQEKASSTLPSFNSFVSRMPNPQNQLPHPSQHQFQQQYSPQYSSNNRQCPSSPSYYLKTPGTQNTSDSLMRFASVACTELPRNLSPVPSLSPSPEPNTNPTIDPTLHSPSSNSAPASFLSEEPKCSYCSICTTGSPLRKVVSHIFGRNKLSTRQIPRNVWVYYCRKHYQRSRYRNPRGFARQQVLLVRRQCERLERWGGVRMWVIKVRRREEVRLQHGGDEDPATADGNWVVAYTGSERSINDVYRLLDRIEAEVQRNGGRFPDVELLPSVDLGLVAGRKRGSEETQERGVKRTRRDDDEDVEEEKAVASESSVSRRSSSSSASWEDGSPKRVRTCAPAQPGSPVQNRISTRGLGAWRGGDVERTVVVAANSA